MSACNIIRLEDSIHMFTDAASYYADGSLGELGQKVSILGHLNCAISCRGPNGFGEELAQAINGAYQSFDELVESFALAVGNFYYMGRDTYALCDTGPEVEVFLAGWSESRDKPESYVVTSHDLNGEPWTLLPLGPIAIAPYDEALAERLGRLEPSENVGEIGVALMEQQRLVKAPHAGGGPVVAGVGGFLQWTAIRRESISTGILKRWDDALGEPMGATN